MEKANSRIRYAQIFRKVTYELKVRIGKYISSKRKKISEKVCKWQLNYNQQNNV